MRYHYPQVRCFAGMNRYREEVMTMKKKVLTAILVCALACFGAFALAACGSNSGTEGSAEETTASDEATVELENDTLIVGFDSAYPPYGYIDTETGEYTGFDLDLAAEVCERNGWTLETTPIDWDAKDALIEQGNITCIWNGFTYEGREDDYAFSGLYMLNAQVIVTKADSDIDTLDDLEGKVVITQVESAALEVLETDLADLNESFDGGAVQTISDYDNAFMQLESGAVDAVACDYSIAAYQMSANEDAYKQLDESLSSEHYAVGFKLGNEALADLVTETLREMDEDGTVEELCEKYEDQGISYENWCLE